VPHVLHLVKDPGNAVALEVIRAQAADPDLRLSVVLLPDALAPPAALPGAVYRLALAEGAAAGAGAPRTIGPSELLDLVFAADSVVTW
jgi:hypothetical protein